MCICTYCTYVQTHLGILIELRSEDPFREIILRPVDFRSLHERTNERTNRVECLTTDVNQLPNLTNTKESQAFLAEPIEQITDGRIVGEKKESEEKKIKDWWRMSGTVHNRVTFLLSFAFLFSRGRR